MSQVSDTVKCPVCELDTLDIELNTKTNEKESGCTNCGFYAYRAIVDKKDGSRRWVETVAYPMNGYKVLRPQLPTNVAAVGGKEDVAVPHGGKMKQLSPAATEALRIIRALRKYPTPQTPIAERKVLKNLSIQDYTDVVLAIEEPDAAQHNAQTRAQ